MEIMDLLDIKYLVIDVDGTMTDAGIYYDDNGNELKKFCTRDAAGFFCAKEVGIDIIVLTGRECQATSRRMQELKVKYVYQNVKDKVSFLNDFINDKKIKKNQIGYIGDDLNDFEPMLMTGFVACPLDACDEVKKISHYISVHKGGNGAVRDCIEYILKERKEWDFAVKQIYSGV